MAVWCLATASKARAPRSRSQLSTRAQVSRSRRPDRRIRKLALVPLAAVWPLQGRGLTASHLPAGPAGCERDCVRPVALAGGCSCWRAWRRPVTRLTRRRRGQAQSGRAVGRSLQHSNPLLISKIPDQRWSGAVRALAAGQPGAAAQAGGEVAAMGLVDAGMQTDVVRLAFYDREPHIQAANPI